MNSTEPIQGKPLRLLCEQRKEKEFCNISSNTNFEIILLGFNLDYRHSTTLRRQVNKVKRNG